MTKSSSRQAKEHLRPIIGLTVVSLLMCGLIFPLLVTGIAQVLFPYQANGEIVQFNGRPVGSELIAQSFDQASFFHARNDSASGVDPHITVDDAYSQIPRISATTGILNTSLRLMVDQNVDGLSKIFGNPYVNVFDLNLALIHSYPSVYANYK